MNEDELKLIRQAAGEFIGDFYLKGKYPGVFRVNPRASYVSNGQVILSICVKKDGIWVPYAEGTAADLRAEVTTIKRE